MSKMKFEISNSFDKEDLKKALFVGFILGFSFSVLSLMVLLLIDGAAIQIQAIR
ncbi:hypothetical protein [Flavobacterium sp. 14A]|uniref:hypothetical protein n=1 Tax=Flavobacterium sp. 14A TaxID=2735896 RepID=UPI00156E4CA2|nr:hypothetical protein [Flavobacterium sp. 14A]NRT11509.1 hypothetical protein [Flavobacterium sp. 14A]